MIFWILTHKFKKDIINIQELEVKEIKKFKFSKETIIGIFLVLLLLVALFDIANWVYQTRISDKKMRELENLINIDNINPNGEIDYENDEEAKLLISERGAIDFDKLNEINSDTKGWIKIDSLGISYPIMQCADNDYYLKKNIYKEDDISGSIFLDYRNNGFDDRHTIIYGHNMKNDSMFGRIDEVLKGKTGTNVDILVLTKDKSYKYKAFSTYEVDPMNFRMSDTIEDAANKSKVDFGQDIYPEGKFISLYTCMDTGKNKTILHAYLEREV